jgi:hypothetical protein
MSKDVKRMLGEIRGSLDAHSREQLVEILAYVFKEYVVEGAAPIAGTTALIDARTELEGLSFAELITWLQLHLDVPELALFEVQGNRVSVRAGGRALPLEARPVEPLPLPPAPAATPSAPVTAPQVIRAQPITQAATSAAPPLATNSQQSSSPAPNSQNAQQSGLAQNPQQSSPAQPNSQNPQQSNTPSTATTDKPEEPGSSSRFSWLEVD